MWLVFLSSLNTYLTCLTVALLFLFHSVSYLLTCTSLSALTSSWINFNKNDIATPKHISMYNTDILSDINNHISTIIIFNFIYSYLTYLDLDNMVVTGIVEHFLKRFFRSSSLLTCFTIFERLTDKSLLWKDGTSVSKKLWSLLI